MEKINMETAQLPSTAKHGSSKLCEFGNLPAGRHYLVLSADDVIEKHNVNPASA
jgi:hypothetical protein